MITILQPQFGQGLAIWRRVRERLRSVVGTVYAGPTAAGKTRVQPNFLAVTLATTKNSWWSRKKFLALRYFSRFSLRQSAADHQLRRRLVQDSAARRRREVRRPRARRASSPSRHRAFDPACPYLLAVCCVAEPCVPL